ncbi:DUF4190 domain-containing protein [Lentzea tibetensis]|uniref:DUF4190 domain-containing protein n=1 Tax=Lentzea tibetensis TaxID=2591470 RepID=A0A563EPK8_9PSEU|nr:DUF4190 domain-containing protein [Lentzea tibetensis]TWP49275.1 DUF4190 domain-containing protein [Lentzea tibetensis]
MYQQPPPYYPPPRRTNTLAIISLVMLFFFAPASIVLGVMARNEIKRTGEDGWGMATAGLIVGIVLTALTALIFIAWIVLLVLFWPVMSDLPNQ